MICGLKWKTCNCPWFNFADLDLGMSSDRHVRHSTSFSGSLGGGIVEPKKPPNMLDLLWRVFGAGGSCALEDGIWDVVVLLLRREGLESFAWRVEVVLSTISTEQKNGPTVITVWVARLQPPAWTYAYYVEPYSDEQPPPASSIDPTTSSQSSVSSPSAAYSSSPLW